MEISTKPRKKRAGLRSNRDRIRPKRSYHNFLQKPKINKQGRRYSNTKRRMDTGKEGKEENGKKCPIYFDNFVDKLIKTLN